MGATLRGGQAVDEEGNGVVGLADDQLLQQLLEQVVDVLLPQEILDLPLVLQLLLLIHIKLYLYADHRIPNAQYTRTQHIEDKRSVHLRPDQRHCALQVLGRVGDDELLLVLDAALVLGHEFVQVLDLYPLLGRLVHQVQHDALEDLGVARVLGPLVLNLLERLAVELQLLVVVGRLQVAQQPRADHRCADREDL